MYTNRKLQYAVRLALGVSASTLALGMSPGALAQDDDADELEEITVTGSRIKRADLDSASPVTILTRADILATGVTDVGNLIQRMPSMSGSPIGTTTNNGNTQEGIVQIDLRGLGVDRTVTLINGHRTVDGGDYQTIPSTMIERVEILKDGASAVYGADAVAGVVNIITRKDFEGFQIEAQTADFFDMDQGAQNTFSLIFGTTFDGGNIVIGAEYVDQEEAYQRDAPWEFFQDSYYIYPEGCENQWLAPYDGTPSGGCFRIGSSRIPESRLGFVSNGTFLIDNPGDVMIPHDGRSYNYAPVNYIQTPYERTNIFAEANFDVTDNVSFSAELRGNFRDSAQELAPMPYNSPTDPGFSGFFNGVPYNGVSEDNYYLVDMIDRYNAANGTALPYEPLRDVRRRMVETTRRFTQDVTQYQAILKLRGTVGDDVDWEVFYNKGQRNLVSRNFGQFFGPALSNAMGPSADLILADGSAGQDGVPECYADVSDSATLIPGCVVFNFFGGAGSVTQEMIDYVAANLNDSYLTNQEIWGASLTGSAFELPGGPLGWAAGVGYWDQNFTLNKDSAKQQNAVTGNKGLSTDGSLYSGSLFVEFFAPVFDNGSQAIDLKGGARYDDYNLFGSDTTWQVGVEFQVMEALKLRATAGTVFRAPTIRDLFDGISDSFPTYSDPCAQATLPAGCNGLVGLQLDNQVLAKVGGNPLLIPETGDTLTAGVAWNPELGEGDLSVTLDWWSTQIDDAITSLGVQFTLDECYLEEVAEACAKITRRSDNSIAQITDTDLNSAEQTAEGIDLEVRWSIDTGVGQFKTALLWTHLLERTKTPFVGAAERDLAGRYSDSTAEDGGAYAEDKINYSVQWYREGLSIGLLGEYISSLTADTFCHCGPNPQPYTHPVDSLLYHDIVASYEWTNIGTMVSLGITNITDEEPPIIETGFNANTDQATYRQFGMGYYLRVVQSFE
jgi:iron complex outermembrane receptor protein